MLFNIAKYRPVWREVPDGTLAALAIFRRHYTFRHYKDGRRNCERYRNRNLFIGPGQKVVLLTPTNDALFAWRKFIDDSGQWGVNCAIFRNEGADQSSQLICAAVHYARCHYWPTERFYTYVDGAKIRSSNPGYCFKQAGWEFVGRTLKGKDILEIVNPFRRWKMGELQSYDLSQEAWREYDVPNRPTPYRITQPKTLFCRPGGTTHRVVDHHGLVHCLPAPGIEGCVLRWQPTDSSQPVQF